MVTKILYFAFSIGIVAANGAVIIDSDDYDEILRTGPGVTVEEALSDYEYLQYFKQESSSEVPVGLVDHNLPKENISESFRTFDTVTTKQDTQNYTKQENRTVTEVKVDQVDDCEPRINELLENLAKVLKKGLDRLQSTGKENHKSHEKVGNSTADIRGPPDQPENATEKMENRVADAPNYNSAAPSTDVPTDLDTVDSPVKLDHPTDVPVIVEERNSIPTAELPKEKQDPPSVEEMPGDIKNTLPKQEKDPLPEHETTPLPEEKMDPSVEEKEDPLSEDEENFWLDEEDDILSEEKKDRVSEEAEEVESSNEDPLPDVDYLKDEQYPLIAVTERELKEQDSSSDVSVRENGGRVQEISSTLNPIFLEVGSSEKPVPVPDVELSKKDRSPVVHKQEENPYPSNEFNNVYALINTLINRITVIVKTTLDERENSGNEDNATKPVTTEKPFAKGGTARNCSDKGANETTGAVKCDDEEIELDIFLNKLKALLKKVQSDVPEPTKIHDNRPPEETEKTSEMKGYDNTFEIMPDENAFNTDSAKETTGYIHFKIKCLDESNLHPRHRPAYPEGYFHGNFVGHLRGALAAFRDAAHNAKNDAMGHLHEKRDSVVDSGPAKVEVKKTR